jgi:integrin beta 2
LLGIPLDPSDVNIQALPPISGISMVTAIDFDAENDYIYWVDTSAHAISRIKRDLTKKEVIVDSGIIGVEGIAVDWMAGNLYWVDQTREVIEVSRLNGTNQYVVYTGDMEKPRSIVVHPSKGYMYWSDSSSTHPRIERARLDGSQHEIFLNSSTDTPMKRPYALAIDYDTDILYWCDLGLDTIMSVDIHTMESKQLVNNDNVTDCMGISVAGNYIYWTDVYYPVNNGSVGTYKQGSLMRANKRDGSDIQVLRQDIGGNVKDVKVFDVARQKGRNLCSENNGGCEELCFYIGDNKRKCHCAHGKLDGGTKCVNYDVFLAYSKVTGIRTVHMFDELNPNDPWAPIENPDYMKNVIGLSFDYKNRLYFYTDIQRGDIQMVGFDGKNPSIVVDKVGSAEGLAYDSVYRELYWTSYTNSSISRIKVNDTRARVEKIVQLEREDHPRAIVIDSCESRIYWTNWNDNRGSIQRAFLSGSPVENIIITDIRTPNGLTIDHKAHKLYWSDARLDKIERCDYDGRNRVVIVQGQPQHAFGLAVYGDFLYWTDWILHGIMRANKYTGGDIKRLKMNIARQPMAIIAVAEDTEDCLLNKCQYEKGGCQQICKTNEKSEKSCSCFDNFVLADDNMTCLALCGINEFVCKTGGCVAYDVICDGVQHCPDNSDEDPNNCETRMCPPNYFSFLMADVCLCPSTAMDRMIAWTTQMNSIVHVVLDSSNVRVGHV